jgi:hypothetical protein
LNCEVALTDGMLDTPQVNTRILEPRECGI